MRVRQHEKQIKKTKNVWFELHTNEEIWLVALFMRPFFFFQPISYQHDSRIIEGQSGSHIFFEFAFAFLWHTAMPRFCICGSDMSSMTWRVRN